MVNNAKEIFENIAHGEKISEASVKEKTGLNLGQIKDAKKWLKENDLIESFRGRGGYFLIKEGMQFPVDETFSEMSKQEKIAAAKAEKLEKNREIKARREQKEKVIAYAKSEFPDADAVQAFWYGGTGDYFYIWVWNGKSAKTYGCYASDIE